MSGAETKLRLCTFSAVAGRAFLWQGDSDAKLNQRVQYMTDFALRRRMMVDTQVRPSDVTKFPIIDAMLRLPREEFVPDALVEAAYIGENLTLETGRVLLDPRTLAKMLDALEITRSDLVLDIGCASGYSSALILQMAQAVVAVEEDEALAHAAEAAFARTDSETVVLHKGALVEGAANHAPYDVMIVQGGIEQFPAALVAQLREGGRVAAVFMHGALGVVRLGIRKGDDVIWRDIFNAAAPVLPGFAAAAAFNF
jgi:protein-L-isoaspartate(D-aspartate) O-methyltransferase